MANKTLKSLNFGGADNYFPLPLVTAADNDKILSVVNGEWAVIDFPGNSGEYVWSRQYAGSSVTEDTTGGTYTLTTDNDTRPSSEIEMSEKAPIYNSETKKWEFPEDGYPTVFNIVNTDNIVPGFPMYHADSAGHGAVYVRVTSEPNIWYTMEYAPVGFAQDSFNVGSASANNTYTKNFSYSRKYTAAIDSSYEEYVAGGTDNKYPDGGWSDGVFYKLELGLAPPPSPYLSFLGNEDFTLKTYNTTKNWDGTLEYSTDTSTWNTWNGTEISSAGCKLYLRGTGNTVITGGSSNYRFVFNGTGTLKMTCEGNIENLLDYETVSAGVHPTMANYCYYYMFYGCTALTIAPELPATTLAKSCYFNMFYGCTSLTAAPALPATTLAESCYGGMFNGCTSLTTAPELPATTLAVECYNNMFYGCTALTTAPALPATTLANYCYYNMFYGCTALTTAPELPATTLADGCYFNMFRDCSLIKLSSSKTGAYTKAYRIPKSGTGTTATNALDNMFTNTGGTFTGTPSINTTYYLSTSNTVV